MSKQNKLLLLLSVLCVIALIVMVIALIIPKEAEQKPFTPPPFDEMAVLGEPSVPDGFGYSVLYQEGMSFKTALCGKVNVVGIMAQIYLTNFEENDVWLKARFYDSNGNIVGESGLIRPGEYVKCVELTKTVKATETYKIKIMSYEPNTYNSLGAITINPRIVVEQ